MDETAVRKCPFAAEEVQATSLKCTYCGEWFEPLFTASAEDRSDPLALLLGGRR